MKLIIVGCGRVGAELAHRLSQKGHKVTVIDRDSAAFSNLPPKFHGRTLEGDALNQSILEHAGIATCDGLAVVTNSDVINTVVAHVARTTYHIHNIVVRNYNPAYRSLYEAFNLQVICSSSWGAQRIEELLSHAEMHTVFSAGNGEVEVYEFAIPLNWAGKRMGDLLSTDACAPVSLTRAGRAFLPTCDTTLEDNDMVVVSATFDGIEALRQRMLARQEE